jgi:phenylalanine ammonia-lyase
MQIRTGTYSIWYGILCYFHEHKKKLLIMSPGVNTAFGGTADLRTQELERLQHTLTRELAYGLLKPGVRDPAPAQRKDFPITESLDDVEEVISEIPHLPWSWVRGAILIRINSLLKGCSAVRPVIIERMRDLLLHRITPMIPARGSISASGDLSPLAYISGAIQGKATIRVRNSDGRIAYADDALLEAGMVPITLKAKEGLAIVNGTSISTSAGALVLHEANVLAFLSQIISAMSVEALLGTQESFHPFFSENRPHPGQVSEVLENP